MNHRPLTRSLRFALAVGLATAAQGASAAPVDFVVTVPASNPVSPALANAVSQNHPSSLYLTATNNRASTNVTQVVVTLPGGYNTQPTGGLGPVGWVLTRVENGKVFFKIADCAQSGTYGMQAGTPHSSQTFRIDVTPPGGAIGTDATDHMGGAAPSDPCGATKGWTTTSGGSILFQRKVLYVTPAAPASGASPFSTSVIFTVKNESNAAKTGVSLSLPAVTQSAGASYTSSACTPASFSLNAGASQAVTCAYVLTAASGGGSTFTFASTASGTPSATAVGAVAGPILVGPATATFAFDSLVTAVGDTVGASFSVANQTAGTITVTPPAYAALSLTNLQQAAGATDPGPASVGVGGTAVFSYTFLVPSGTPLSSSYLASGAASTTAGSTNVANTPAGTVGAVLIGWAPAALVKARVNSGKGPYLFTVTVLNSSASAIKEIDIVNPQKASWTGLADNGGSTFKAGGLRHPVPTTDLLPYTGTLAIGATAILNFKFTDIPPNAADGITGTKVYPFQVTVIPVNAANLTVTRDFSVADSFPIDDVANAGVLSGSAGQTVYWTNKDTPARNEYHDGVVIFVTAAGTVPPPPVDCKDYQVDALPSGVIRSYADDGGSLVASWVDADATGTPAAPGAFNYRICNHDANFIYSSCSTSFWNNAGWLDSAVPPAGGWTHTSGYQALLYPGIEPGGRVAIASNAPALNVLAAATGTRPFDPAPLAAVPAMGTPIATLGNGRQILFAADQGGVVTAVDMTTGAGYWQVTKAGESFVAGVGGALRQYTVPTFQSKYANDVLFLGSTTGKLLALDATTGSTLWTATAGTAIRALPLYDYAKNWLYVPTDGGGILAYDLGSAPTPPSAATGWTNPAGAYTVGCARADVAAQMTCVDKSGGIKVLDRSTGATAATGTFTGVGTPSSIWKVSGGLVVGSAGAVQTFTLSGAAFTSRGTYKPSGVTLSPVQVFASAGFVYIGGSDLKLHKLALADATELGAVTVTSQQAGTLLGPAVFDVSSNLFVFGASDGHVWAVPYF